jgi:hypothetical protein
MESGDGDDPVAYCWGCNTLILVPCVDGKPAILFKVSLFSLNLVKVLSSMAHQQGPTWSCQELPGLSRETVSKVELAYAVSDT